MDVELLFSFLQATQPDALARLEKLYGGKTRQTILNYINNEVNKKSRSLLDVLKHGVEFDNGVSLNPHVPQACHHLQPKSGGAVSTECTLGDGGSVAQRGRAH